MGRESTPAQFCLWCLTCFNRCSIFWLPFNSCRYDSGFRPDSRHCLNGDWRYPAGFRWHSARFQIMIQGWRWVLQWVLVIVNGSLIWLGGYCLVKFALVPTKPSLKGADYFGFWRFVVLVPAVAAKQASILFLALDFCLCHAVDSVLAW